MIQLLIAMSILPTLSLLIAELVFTVSSVSGPILVLLLVIGALLYIMAKIRKNQGGQSTEVGKSNMPLPPGNAAKNLDKGQST